MMSAVSFSADEYVQKKLVLLQKYSFSREQSINVISTKRGFYYDVLAENPIWVVFDKNTNDIIGYSDSSRIGERLFSLKARKFYRTGNRIDLIKDIVGSSSTMNVMLDRMKQDGIEMYLTFSRLLVPRTISFVDKVKFQVLSTYDTGITPHDIVSNVRGAYRSFRRIENDVKNIGKSFEGYSRLVVKP